MTEEKRSAGHPACAPHTALKDKSSQCSAVAYEPPRLTSLGNVRDLLGKVAGTPDGPSGMKD